MDAGLAIRDTGTEPETVFRRAGFVLLVASAYPECNCPDDCDRDHPNE